MKIFLIDDHIFLRHSQSVSSSMRKFFKDIYDHISLRHSQSVSSSMYKFFKDISLRLQGSQRVKEVDGAPYQLVVDAEFTKSVSPTDQRNIANAVEIIIILKDKLSEYNGQIVLQACLIWDLLYQRYPKSKNNNLLTYLKADRRHLESFMSWSVNCVHC
jgi:hypothetical protein